jgi:polysaccharide biosynthesis transport protein
MSAKNIDNTNLSSHITGDGINALPSEFHLFKVLSRRRWQLFACLLVVCSVALASVFMCKPKYKATAQVEVVLDQPKASGSLTDLLGGGGNGTYFNTQCALLESRRVLALAAERLGVAGSRWAYSEEASDEIRDRLSIRPVKGSQLIDIVGIAPEPAEAAAIANQVATAFVETSATAHKANNKRIVNRLTQQVSNFDQEIQTLENNIDQFRKDNQITGDLSTFATAETRLSEMERKADQLRMDKLEQQNRRDHIGKLLEAGDKEAGSALKLQEVAADALMTSMTQQLNTLQQEEMQLARVYLPGHDKLSNVRLRIADIQAKILQRSQTVMANLHEQAQQQCVALAEQEQSIQNVLQQQRTSSVALTGQRQQYVKMLSNLEMAQRLRNEVIGNLRQFTLSQEINEVPVTVVDAACVPARQAGLSAAHRAGSILLLGLLFSIFFVITIDRFAIASSMPSPVGFVGNMPVSANGSPMMSAVYWPGMATKDSASTQASSDSSVKVLGRVGSIAFAGKGDDDKSFAARCQVVYADQSASEAGAFREIASKLLSRFGHTQQSIVLTGTEANIGKTTCGCNLALMLAQSGRKVALIETDPQKQSLDICFSSDGSRLDLGAFLADTSEIDIALQTTNVSGVSMMQVDVEPSWPECDRQAAWSALNRELSGRFDWVIYDAGTVHTQSTRQLLQTVGKSLFVTGEKQSSTHKDIVENIERCGAVCIGGIENSPGVHQSQRSRHSVSN